MKKPDSWHLDGDLSQDPIAQSLKIRVAEGCLKESVATVDGHTIERAT